MDSSKRVVEVQESRMPWGYAKGKPCKPILEVLYDDGSVMYRCADCGYERETFQSVFAHRSRKHPRPRVDNPKVGRLDAQGALKILSEAVEETISRADVRALERKIERLESRLAESQKARRRAEGDLNRIRAALSGA